MVNKDDETLDLMNVNDLNHFGNAEVKDSDQIVYVSKVKELTLEDLDSDGLTDANLDDVVGKIVSAIINIANVEYKSESYIEPCEIDKVKKILKKEQCEEVIKEEIENELTKFQEKIQIDYKQKLKDYKDKKDEFEEQLELLTKKRSKLVSKRLYSLSWPFDEKTRLYDEKIDRLKYLIQVCDEKMRDFASMRPAAREKDILIFKHNIESKLL